MRLRVHKFSGFISPHYEISHKIHLTIVDKFVQKALKTYNKLRGVPRDGAEDFLDPALSAYRQNNVEDALRLLEEGLNLYPGSEKLLAYYLQISCKKGQFSRIASFIKSDNEPLRKTLLNLSISNSDNRRRIESGKKDGLAWLTEKIINSECEDVLAYWRIADLLEYAGRGANAGRIYKILTEREPRSAEDCVYASLADRRLGNIDGSFKRLELSLATYPEAENIKSAYAQLCYLQFDFDRYQKFRSLFCPEIEDKNAPILDFYRSVFKLTPPESFIMNFQKLELSCGAEDFQVVKEEFFSDFCAKTVTVNSAKISILFCRFLDLDKAFSEKLFSILYFKNWGTNDEAVKYLLTVIYKLTLPITPHRTSELEGVVKQFVIDAQELARKAVVLTEPLADLGKQWYAWQSLFCLNQPHLYRDAMAAFEALALRIWPRLDYTAPHIGASLAANATTERKIRIGFTVLDVMPMMSGLMDLLDKKRFETFFLRPGSAGNSKAASDWLARADNIVEYSDTDAYSAIKTIAEQELDILISGPSGPQILFPIIARLARLQMILLEPNWSNGFRNADYYISWQLAEPKNYKRFYQTPVSLMQNPPYWIEKSSLGQISPLRETDEEVRQRLLGLGPDERFYICPNVSPKIHPMMDEILCKLLVSDPGGRLVLLRSEHAISQALKSRIREKFVDQFERVIFLNTLNRSDAHALLLSSDCCLDSYPICGMSSSFDGLMLGVPIVTLPAEIPFGRWTAAIYEYIGVTGLTALDMDEYIGIALRLAHDKAWRLQKSAEIREKSSRYVESRASFEEFQQFLIQAWRRKQAGLPPGNWIAGKWQ
jgi:hypothetical protein